MGWSIDWPNAVSLEGGETPPGWEAASTDLDTYSVTLNECQRVSIGAFERGPVRFLIESRWGFDPPESCIEFSPDYDRMMVLVSMWMDDPELVDYLRDAYGLPMRWGEFNLEVTEQGGDEMQAWTWKNGTNPDSQAVGFHVGPTTPLPYIERLVWHNGTAVSFLDLTDDYALPLVPVPTAEGTMATPMRYADRGMNAFVGAASIWKQADFSGPFYRFGDLECKQRLD